MKRDEKRSLKAPCKPAPCTVASFPRLWRPPGAHLGRILGRSSSSCVALQWANRRGRGLEGRRHHDLRLICHSEAFKAPPFGAQMVSAPHSASWKLVVLYIGFHLTATWTQSCALRPMCGDLVKNSQDRAQILALWSLGASRLQAIPRPTSCLRAILEGLRIETQDCLGGHHLIAYRSSTGWSSCRGKAFR